MEMQNSVKSHSGETILMILANRPPGHELRKTDSAGASVGGFEFECTSRLGSNRFSQRKPFIVSTRLEHAGVDLSVLQLGRGLPLQHVSGAASGTMCSPTGDRGSNSPAERMHLNGRFLVSQRTHLQRLTAKRKDLKTPKELRALDSPFGWSSCLSRYAVHKYKMV